MRTTCRWTALLALLCSTAAAIADEAADRATANKAELAKLQGQWRVVSLLVRGEEKDEVVKQGLMFDFKDDALTVTATDANFAVQHRLLRLETNATPKGLDFAETAKAFDEHKDVVEGVYTLDGDKLQWCFNLDGDQPAKGRRPAAVESRADSSAALIKLERVKN